MHKNFLILLLGATACIGLMVWVVGEMTTSKKRPSDGFAGSSPGARVRVSTVAPLASAGMAIVVSSMQAIPQELYEAVRVDGAGPVREFFTVTLPNLRGPMSVVLALTMIGAIRLFDLVWLTTKGGPGISTITPTVVLYERAFANPEVGSAAAIGVVMTLVSLLVVLVIVKVAEGRAE